MATGKKMSEYTPFSSLNSEEKATYLGNAAVTTFGAKVSEGDNINVNIPLSTLVPSVPVTDVTVNGSSVVSDGVAAVTVPTATGLAGDGLSVNAGQLVVSNKVPAPTATTDRGKVLTVNNSDEVVWDTPSGGSTEIIGGSDGAIYGSGAYCYVRTDENTIVVNSQNQLHANFNIIDGSGSVIDVQHGDGIHIGFDTTGATVGDVLTVTQNGANWAAPGGGAPVPTPTSADVGKVLTVDSSDNIVWDEVPSSQLNYGEGLEYDSNTNTLKFNYLGSGGLTYEHGPDKTRGMKVKAGVGIEVDNKGVSIDTQHANEGDVLTYHKNGSTDEVVWEAPGGGGGGLPNPSELVGKNTDSGAGFASFVPYCTVTCDAGNNVISVGPIKWGYKWHSPTSSPVDGDMT